MRLKRDLMIENKSGIVRNNRFEKEVEKSFEEGEEWS